MNELLNIDCMKYMRTQQDNAFDLAIVDPPYGIGENWNKDRFSKFYKHTSTYKNKNIPKKNYFDELFRVSKKQIIWGANYYWNYLSPSNNLIFWDKGKNTLKTNMSSGELAWTNITKYPLITIRLKWDGFMTCELRSGIHPHEKPIALYRWLLRNYAEPGQRVLDTHGGSMSIAIACISEDYDLTLCGIDKDYFNAGIKRIKRYLNQGDLFRDNTELIINNIRHIL